MPIGLHKPGQQPLYLFHDGSGKTGMYERLTLSGYNLFGIYSLDFEQINPSIQTLEALAALYIEKAHLLEVQNAIFGGMWRLAIPNTPLPHDTRIRNVANTPYVHRLVVWRRPRVRSRAADSGARRTRRGRPRTDRLSLSRRSRAAARGRCGACSRHAAPADARRRPSRCPIRPPRINAGPVRPACDRPERRAPSARRLRSLH